MEHTELGSITLESHQEELIKQFADVILNGTLEQAKEVFAIVFEREPNQTVDMEIFKALCKEALLVKEEMQYGIQGVVTGGKAGDKRES